MAKTTYEVNAFGIQNGNIKRLCTTSPLLTIKECDRIVEDWSQNHNLIVSWVVAKYATGSTKVEHLKEYKF